MPEVCINDSISQTHFLIVLIWNMKLSITQQVQFFVINTEPADS